MHNIDLRQMCLAGMAVGQLFQSVFLPGDTTCEQACAIECRGQTKQRGSTTLEAERP